jgi:hypothetical protein
LTTRQVVWAARLVAEPAATGVRGHGMVLGAGPSAAYVDFDGFVVAITARSVPLMPNGISLHDERIPPLRRGSIATIERGLMDGTDAVVDLTRARTWDPAVAANLDCSAGEVARRCRDVLDECRPAELPSGAAELAAAMRACDPVAVAAAVGVLLGHGGGLTPQGDDVVAGAAAALAAFGTPAGTSSDLRACLLAALCPADRRRRTTSLSATLIELAAAGKVADALGSILDLRSPENEWRRSLGRLRHLGHSTGLTWCAAASASGTALVGDLRL